MAFNNYVAVQQTELGDSSDCNNDNHLKRSPHPPPSIPVSPLQQKPDRVLENQPDAGQQLLSRSWHSLILRGTTDFIICLAASTFLVLAWCAFALSGKELSTWGQSVQEWSLVAPTIFPIIFAAVVTRSTRTIATYLLERGVSLSTLEQLILSTNVSSSLLTQVQLRSPTLVGISLAFLWLFSPAGGQASLRLLSTKAREYSNTSNIAYVNSANQTSIFFDALQTSYCLGQVQSIYTASLLAGPETKSSTMDMWGNVKIPYMDSTNISETDLDGWAPVLDQNVTYSSLLGYVVGGLPTTGTSSYRLASYYYDVSCQKLWHVPFENGVTRPDWLTPLNIPKSLSYSGRNTTNIFEGSQGRIASFFITRYDNDILSPHQESNILFGALYNSVTAVDAGITLANCTIRPVFVESSVDCKNSTCGVSRMRRAKPYGKTTYFWSRNLMASQAEDFILFAGTLPLATPGNFQFHSSATEIFLWGNESFPFAETEYAADTQVALYNIPINDFSRRLGTVLNTYWLSATVGLSSTGNLRGIPANQMQQATCSGVTQCFIAQNATATVTHSVMVYVCHMWWLALLVVASSLLLVTAVVGAVLRWMSVSPDILGYASTMTRDNPYIHTENTSTALDGLERTRALSGMKLRLVDVLPDDTIGHTAVTADVEKMSRSNAKLCKNRYYL